MVKKIIILSLLLVLAATGTGIVVSGATGCTVKYYYTSEQNPESVPAATTGFQSGSKWKIKPAGPSKTVYSGSRKGKAITYTFDGWYTNINCRGTKYLPGRETTAIVPSATAGRYTVNLYGRWVCADGSAAVKRSKMVAREMAAATETQAENTEAASADKGSSSAPKKKSSASSNADVDQNKQNGESSSTIEPAVTESDEQQEEQTKEPVTVTAFEEKSRAEVLSRWRHLLIDTFFYINGRKYSYALPGKYWTDSSGAWNGKTGKNGNTQSCVTLTTVSLKRAGIIPHNCGSIWLSSNNSSSPNKTVKNLKKTSPLLTIFYPHKSLKSMAASGRVKYGDILCRSGHTFVYMGMDSGGHPLIYESGTHRDIGNGTAVTWGHHAGGHANKLTGKINKQIKKSDAIGVKWRRGEISDAAFAGHKSTGNNLNKPVHVVCSINTFTVRTSCTDGTITSGSAYMAGQDVTVSYSPSEGKTIDSVKVDGKDVDLSQYGASFTFPKISANHQISVVYK